DDKEFTFVSLSREELLSIIGVDPEESDFNEFEEDESSDKQKKTEAESIKKKEMETNEEKKKDNESSLEIIENKDEKEDNEDDIELQNAENQEQDIEEMDLSNYYLFEYYLDTEITVRELALMYSTDEELIEQANPNGRDIGTYIKIPVPESQIYVMQKGDTLWSLFRKFGVSVESLKELNQINDESNISEGSILYIPGEL
ncbi:MAG: LysM peptidoglycan-binding domain-containing protein, partial [bacterium]